MCVKRALTGVWLNTDCWQRGSKVNDRLAAVVLLLSVATCALALSVAISGRLSAGIPPGMSFAGQAQMNACLSSGGAHQDNNYGVQSLKTAWRSLLIYQGSVNL